MAEVFVLFAKMRPLKRSPPWNLVFELLTLTLTTRLWLWTLPGLLVPCSLLSRHLFALVVPLISPLCLTILSMVTVVV